MPNLAVNRPSVSDDLAYNPRQPGKTNLAYGAYENPNTFSAMTSNGDFAGEVSANYNGKVRIIDPVSGDPLFEGTGPEATGAAFNAVNAIAKEKGRNASWAVQIDDGKGGWATAASDFVDPKEASPLGMLADVALPLIASIVLPGIGGFVAGPWLSAALAAGGSAVSSLAQGRPMDETLKRAIISGASAGLGKFASGAIGNALANSAGSAASSEMGSMLASAAARGTITAAEAATAGATAAQMIAAGVPAAAAQAAASAAGNTIGELFVQGGANTAGNVTNAALQTASGLGQTFVQGGIGGDVFGTNLNGQSEGVVSEGQATEDFVSDPLTVVGKGGSGTAFDRALQAGNSAASDSVEELLITGKANLRQINGVHRAIAWGMSPEEAAFAFGLPLATVAIIQSGGSAIEAAGLADPAVGGSQLISEGIASGGILGAGKATAAWIAAHPLLAAQLGLIAADALGGGGSGVGANGLATGGGTPPALQQSALFKKALPAASGIFANLAPRDVSKSVTDWNKYGEGGEQSFFANVPVRANGVTPDPNLVVTPAPSTGGGGTSTGTTGTGTTGTTTSPQTPTNLAVQNMATYGKTPDVLDLRNQPTSVNNPYAGYATTRTPPTGAVALPENSNARFVVQDPMTAADLEKQARLTAQANSYGSMPDVLGKSSPDLAVKSTGTPPQPANPPSLAVNAPTGRPTDAYSQADIDRFAVLSPDTAKSMQGINDTMARVKTLQNSVEPTTDGAMNQFQLNALGLKEQPTTKAPVGVDPLSYYMLTKPGNFMSPAEINSYNESVKNAPELLGTKLMAQINSPEWFSEHFGLDDKQARAAAAQVGGQSAVQKTQTALPTAPSGSWAANPEISNPGPQRNPNPSNLNPLAGLAEYIRAHPEVVDRIPALGVNLGARETPAEEAARNAGGRASAATEDAIFANGAKRSDTTGPSPFVANPEPARLAADVQAPTSLNVPNDVMKQLEGYNFQFKHGGTTSRAFAVKGAGDGREDKIDAKLSDGEYVIDAETVALLGNGSSKAGADKLDNFRVNIRKHKGQKLASGKFSANAKSPEAYLAGGRR